MTARSLPLAMALWSSLGASGCSGLQEMEALPMVGPMPASVRPEPGLQLEVVTPDGVRLHGFLVRARGRSRGTIVLLHGLGASAAFWAPGAADLAREGYDVLAWDGRGNGLSGGRCTYGARERHDVSTMLDAAARAGARTGRTLLFGYSLGAGVALQAAPLDPRVRAVVAVAPWTTLRRLVRRVAWAAPASSLNDAIRAAERVADFRMATVRPIDSVRRLHVPLLVVAGTDDRVAPPSDAEAIVEAAASRRARLVLVPGATHDDVLFRCGPACRRAMDDLLGEAGML